MDVFYAYESSSSLFWVIFSMLSVIVGAVWINGIAGSVADLWLVLLGLAHTYEPSMDEFAVCAKYLVAQNWYLY